MMVNTGRDALWVHDSGGDAVPVVLLHPGIADSTIWDRLLPLLTDRRVIRCDRRGFGRSPIATEEFTPVEDLYAVLAALDVERAHLVGNSMGGECALAAAIGRPDLVASLTLLCSGVTGYDWPAPTEEEQLDFARYRAYQEAGDHESLTELLLEVWCAMGSDDCLRAQMRAANHADAEQEGLEQQHTEQWSHLPDLHIPTTVVAASLDPRDSLCASLDLAKQIPGAELVQLEVDHLPQYREPSSVAQIIERTIAR